MIRVVLLGVWRDERETLFRALAAEPHFRLLPVSHYTEALPALAAETVDALVGDLALLLLLRQAWAETARHARPVPTLVLVSPGEEARAARLLERDSADVLLRAGDYHALLLAWVRRAHRQRHNSREEVAAIIRHEINNPLTGVLGNAELILAEGTRLSRRARQRLTTIIQLAVRLRDVVRNLETRLQPDEPCGEGAHFSERGLRRPPSPGVLR